MDDSLIPLAERLRPASLDEVIGQEHITGHNKILRRVIETKKPINVIFWGPPGSGKTTLARIIANDIAAVFFEISAVSSGKKEVLQIIEQARGNRRLGQATVLFIDEIHRFNKAQQDAFLPVIEDGTICLIGATTENPSFEVIPALLSRCRVSVLKPITNQNIIIILEHARNKLKLSQKLIPNSIISLIADLSDSDARAALNLLELSLNLAENKHLTKSVVEAAAQQRIPHHDKKGESHYNLISALIKSLRGSDINAAFYYLARLIDGGEDAKFIARRLVVFASEDIGLAAPAALNISVSTFLAVERIGMPEAKYNLFSCVAVLAKSPKSREVTDAMYQAELSAKKWPNLPVPLHLRNAPTKLMKDLGYNKDYKWQAGYSDERGFMPDELKNTDFFKP